MQGDLESNPTLRVKGLDVSTGAEGRNIDFKLGGGSSQMVNQSISMKPIASKQIKFT